MRRGARGDDETSEGAWGLESEELIEEVGVDSTRERTEDIVKKFDFISLLLAWPMETVFWPDEREDGGTIVKDEKKK